MLVAPIYLMMAITARPQNLSSERFFLVTIKVFPLECFAIYGNYELVLLPSCDIATGFVSNYIASYVYKDTYHSAVALTHHMLRYVNMQCCIFSISSIELELV